MSIRNRLFLSNILMIFLPLVLIYLIVSGLMLIFTGVANRNDFGSYAMFFNMVNKFDAYAVKWSQNPDIETIKADVDTFNKEYEEVNKMLYILQGDYIIYPEESLEETPKIMLPGSGEHLSVMDEKVAYKKTVGDYTIVMLDMDFALYRARGAVSAGDVYINYAILVAMAVIIIILLINRFLVGFVISGIETAIDGLIYGVNQIRDGNLNYRINYKKKDEFALICSDFNEMAARLLDFVNASQKDEANRRELIAGISHDLRTPLTSIKAYIEGLEKGVAATPEAQRRYLEIIQSKTEDLTHIVNQLFMFSKLDIGEFPFSIERLDIGGVLSGFINEVADEYMEKGLEITLKKNLSGVYVEADAVQLRNAFGNILENSLKYKDKEQGKIMINCRENGGGAEITFADNGPGIHASDVSKIFDVFYQSDPSRTNPSSGRIASSGKGSGLGLAITAKILERLGGGIRAESPDTGGLTIVITLPGCMEKRYVE